MSFDEPSADPPRDGDRALNAQTICWYCNKKGPRKSECRKRKAELRKNVGYGRQNGELVHAARIRIAATAFVDSGADYHIVNYEMLAVREKFAQTAHLSLTLQLLYKINSKVPLAIHRSQFH